MIGEFISCVHHWPWVEGQGHTVRRSKKLVSTITQEPLHQFLCNLVQICSNWMPRIDYIWGVICLKKIWLAPLKNFLEKNHFRATIIKLYMLNAHGILINNMCTCLTSGQNGGHQRSWPNFFGRFNFVAFSKLFTLASHWLQIKITRG